MNTEIVAVVAAILISGRLASVQHGDATAGNYRAWAIVEAVKLMEEAELAMLIRRAEDKS